MFLTFCFEVLMKDVNIFSGSFQFYCYSVTFFAVTMDSIFMVSVPKISYFLLSLFRTDDILFLPVLDAGIYAPGASKVFSSHHRVHAGNVSFALKNHCIIWWTQNIWWKIIVTRWKRNLPYWERNLKQENIFLAHTALFHKINLWIDKLERIFSP